MSQAIAELLVLGFFFLLAVFFLGIAITRLTDGASSPPKMTQTQARNKARQAIRSANVQLFTRRVRRFFRGIYGR